MKYLIIIAIVFSFQLNANDITFIELEDYELIRHSAESDNEIYFVSVIGNENYIYKLNKTSLEKTLLFDNEEFENHNINRIIDLILWKGDLIISAESKIVNLSDNFKELKINDDFSEENSSKYRKYYRMCIDSTNNLIVGGEARIVKDTINGIVYTHSHGEILRIDDNSINVVYRSELNSGMRFDLKPICDINGNIWFIQDQSTPGQDGLVKFDKNEKLMEFDLESYSSQNKTYLLQPTFIQFLNNEFVIGYWPRKETGYFEGMSFYNPVTDNWKHTIEYLEFHENFNDFKSWFIPKGAKQINDSINAFLGRGIIFEYPSGYKYVNVNEQVSNYFNFDHNNYDVIDIYNHNNNYIVVQGKAILVYKDNLITDVEEYNISDVIVYPNPTRDILKISTELDIKSLSIYNLSMKKVKEITVFNENTIYLNSLPAGIYFLDITTIDGQEFIEKVIKQ